MYVRWDWEPTLAWLRPLLSISLLPELGLLESRWPGRQRKESGEDLTQRFYSQL